MNGPKFEKKLNNNYFLIDADRLLLTHLPADPKWQLLKNPVARKEFEEWPLISSDLLNLGQSTKEIHAAIKKKTEFVKAFGFPGNSTVVINAPLSKSMEVDQEYKFKIKSDDFAEVAFHCLRTNQMQALEKEGRFFVGSFTPAEKGDFRISGRKDGENLYHGILQYVAK